MKKFFVLVNRKSNYILLVTLSERKFDEEQLKKTIINNLERYKNNNITIINQQIFKKSVIFIFQNLKLIEFPTKTYLKEIT